MSERGRSPGPSGQGGDTQRGSRSPSVRSGTQRGPGSPSRSGSQGPAAGWVQGPGHDPARSAGGQRQEGPNTRLELPPDAYVSDTKKDMFIVRGNKFNTEGKPAEMLVNQYRMKKFDYTKKIFQYDISVSPDTKRSPMKKILSSSEIQKALANYAFHTWIFDGRKLAWAPGKVDRGEVRFQVDLDAAHRKPGEEPRPGAIFTVHIRQTTEIHVSALQGYLERKIPFTTEVQEALNFIDHLFRAGPSQRLLSIKRNFYDTKVQGEGLLDGRVVEVHKGAYASVRMSHNLTQGGIGLALNVDVANTAFWVSGQSFDALVCNFLGSCESRWKGITTVNASQQLRPIGRKDNSAQSSEAFKQLRKLRKLKFKVIHKGRKETAADKVMTVIDFMFGSKYGPEGGNARNVQFEYEGKMTSVFDYYRLKYGVTLKYVNLPLIDAGKSGAIPMELCFIEPMQRYNYKLNPEQTASMIKIAVTRPKVRKAAIEEKFNALKLSTDPFLKYYGVEFNTGFTKTQAKVIQPPVLKFKGPGSVTPKFAGRWDLRGMKFWKPNLAPLTSWGIVMMDNCVDARVAEQFAATFRQTYTSHGGNVPQSAKILNPPGNLKGNAAGVVAWAFTELTKERGYPQLLFIVVGHKNSPHYERLKKNTDCRFGILSQVVQRSHVMANSGQYHSNVAMKVNAKLGGSTSRTDPPWKNSGATYYPANRPTMVVGVDVSHAAPGANTASVAAMTMNCDADANRFVAVCETNGYRTEMITPHNIHNMFGQLASQWKNNHAVPPAHVIYFRDGVAEGQFAQVMDIEIAEIKTWFKIKGIPIPKFTVIVATKRHHIRFFPANGGDKNANPLPGTLVEKEVTHPFMWDFYLNSHVAIQGTARPVHYYILQDEMGVPVNDFQKMIYYQCYSYARSTTPVSLHPAVYYAHLAGARARAHENIASTEGFRAGGKGHEVHIDKAAKGLTVAASMYGAEAPALLPLGGITGKEGPEIAGEDRQRRLFRSAMWYI